MNATVETPTLVFDGDCAFCTSSVRWARRWCRPAVRFVPWQNLDLAANGLSEEAVTTAVQWLRPTAGGRPIPSGAAAVARLLLRSRWPFRPLGALLLIPPFSWLGRGLYRLIADNRQRLPGGTPACAVDAHRPAAASVQVPAQPEPAETLQDAAEAPVRLDDLLD